MTVDDFIIKMFFGTCHRHGCNGTPYRRILKHAVEGSHLLCRDCWYEMYANANLSWPAKMSKEALEEHMRDFVASQKKQEPNTVDTLEYLGKL